MSMSGYKRAIADAIHTDQDLDLVEGIMRDDNHGLLDDLTERQFDARARAAYVAAQELLASEQADVVAYYRKRGA